MAGHTSPVVSAPHIMLREETNMDPILWWIVVGIIAGFLAKAVVPGEGPGGILGDLVVGIVGAVIGGWIMRSLGYAGAGAGLLWGILVAFIGAVVLLLILRAITSRRVAY